MATAVSQTKKERFASRARKKITQFSKGLSIVLAAAAEPLMRYTTIYLALATALPVIKLGWLYGACQGVVISAPEFVIIGAFNIADEEIKKKDGQHAWGWTLRVICFLMSLIMIATFVDIFIVQFSVLAIKILNFSRCMIAVGFTVTLSKLDKDEDEEDQAASMQVQPAATQPQPDITEALTKAVEKIKEDLSQQVNEGLQKIRADVLSHVHITEDNLSNQSDQSDHLLTGPSDQKAAMSSTNAERTADIEQDNRAAMSSQKAAIESTEKEDVSSSTITQKAANEPDKLELTLQFLHEHPGHANDEDIDAQLAPVLGLKRPASARFWRLKAQEIMQATAEKEAANASEQGSFGRLLAYVQSHEPATQKEIATTLNISERTVRRHLAAMRKSGQLQANWMEDRTVESGQDSGHDLDEKADRTAPITSLENRPKGKRTEVVSSPESDLEEDRTADNVLRLRVVK